MKQLLFLWTAATAAKMKGFGYHDFDMYRSLSAAGMTADIGQGDTGMTIGYAAKG